LSSRLLGRTVAHHRAPIVPPTEAGGIGSM
jgi:hypothetical protein